MEFLVDMVTTVPPGTTDREIAEVRARRAESPAPPVAAAVGAGEWHTCGLFRADDAEQLERVLASMPLRVWRRDTVTPLSPHPNDPGILS